MLLITLLPSTILGLEARDNCAFRCVKDREAGAITFCLTYGLGSGLLGRWDLGPGLGVADRSILLR